jgi:ATP-dependent helicase/nuclease subunit A
VVANAGSGKTQVLVERYLDLVLHGRASAQEIVALTFTEKAAGELRRKIADRIAEELGSSEEPSRTARLERLRSELSGATIGTIHSFCARILRDHPVEAHVDAAFGVIEGLDQRIMLQEALRDTLTHILRGPGENGLRDSVGEAVGLLGKLKFRHLVATLVEKREQFERWRVGGGFLTCGDEEVYPFWDAAIRDFVIRETQSRRMQQQLQRVVEQGDGQRLSEVEVLYRRIGESSAPSVKVTTLLELLDTVLTAKGEVSKRFAKQCPDEIRPDAQSLGRWRNQLRALLEHVVDSRYQGRHETLLSLTRTALEVASLTLDRYTHRKLESGQLDFEDLQLLAKKLLGRDEVARHLAARFRFILVDEYQDTNQLQYDILLPILGNLDQGNLFVVGDPKQSIYGFRNANVAVFERTKQDLIGHSGPRAEVILEESFRPLRELVAFVNLLFSRLLRGPEGEGAPHQSAYEPLCQARANQDPGRVEILLCGDGDGAPPSEAELIARRILQLQRAGHQVYGRDEFGRAFQFRDAAVLLRSRLPLPEVEEAFSRIGVPYVVTGGVGYFQTQDIIDFYNYFTFLLDSGSDVALAGILRSPFFGVSDAELLAAAEAKGERNLWEHLLAAAGGDTLSDTLVKATSVLRADRDVALRMTVPELIDYIVRQTLYVSKMAGNPRAEQALANLGKLRRMAASYDAQGFTNLQDFTLRLKRLIEEEQDEGQGVVESLRDAVQILTIHAAKGLEFPVVFLPYLHKRFRYDQDPFLDDRLGIGFSFRGRGGEENEEVPLTLFLKEVTRERTIAEEKRVFYVGATRARDLLVLSGETVSDGSAPTRMGWLIEALGIRGDLDRDILQFPTAVTVLTRDGDAFKSDTVRHTLHVHLTRPEDTQLAPPAGPPVEERVVTPQVLIEPVAPRASREVFSATKIRTYRECPTLYYLRYILGFPEKQVSGGRLEDDEISECGLYPEAVGRAFHAVMQKIDRLTRDEDAIAAEVLSFLQREGPFSPEGSSSTIARVVSLVMRTVSAPLWRDIEGGTSVKTEFTISAPLGVDYIMGTIDRIYRDAEGVLSVLDYKTDAVEGDLLQEKARAYLPQVQFYALLASRYYEASPVRTILFFTSRPMDPVLRLYSRSDLEEFESEISRIVAEIKAGRFPAPPQQCRVCPFPPGSCPSEPSQLT